MEGACGKILNTENPNVVVKKLHRHKRAQQRTSSLRGEEQARLQEWARILCVKAGFKRLFVPRAWDATPLQYKMDRIDTQSPLPVLEAATHPVLPELRSFFFLAKQHKVYPADFELYVQPDGRVALIDVDKFAAWEDDTLVFPWGLRLPAQPVLAQIPFLL